MMRVAGAMAMAALLAGVVACGPRTTPGLPDLTGTWMPDATRAQPWPAELPLTEPARARLAQFNPQEHDPVTYCMPYGTPRNMLQTDYVLEIAQTPQRVVMVLQPNLANAEVRRIRLDAQKPAEPPDASWFGTSFGHWEGSTLVVETIGLRPDALVSGTGLAHSDELRVVERLSVVDDAQRGRTLVDDIELHDAKAYTQPLKTRRYFVSAPQAKLGEPGNCIEQQWIGRLWRDRLGEHAEHARKAGSK